MRLPPPDVLASWPPPNYDDPESRGPALLITELIIMPLALLTLAARLYCRISRVHNSGLDDWLMVAAMLFCIGCTVCVILATKLYGWDIHAWDLTEEQTIRGRQASISVQTLFLIASSFAKASILASYLRIAPAHSWLRRLTHASIWLITALAIIFFIVLWTQCIPMSEYWNLEADNRHCGPESPPLMAQTITSVITDFLVYVLPLPTLVTLRLPPSQRIALLLVFSLGFIVVVAGCQRAYWTHHVVDETYDVTWGGFDLWIWTAVEVNLGVICGSIPTLRPLFRKKGEMSSYASRSTVVTPASGTAHTRGASGLSGTTRVAWSPESRGPMKTMSRCSEVGFERGVGEYSEIESPVTPIEMQVWLKDHDRGTSGIREW